MKNYVQFQHLVNGKIVDGCGSDSVFILDGRNNLSTMIQDAEQRRDRLKLAKGYIAFKIMQGSRFSDNNKIVHQSNVYFL